MGTNWIFPSISFITFAVTAILQLALAMDYSIMLLNRYRQQRLVCPDNHEAMKGALGLSFGAITGSSLTTFAGLLALLSAKHKDLKHLNSPDKIYLDNTTLMFAMSTAPDTGTLRETFFYNQLSKDHDVLYPKQGDFLVDSKYLFEVGGKGKSFDQVKDIDNSYLAVADTEVGRKSRIPLWMFGLLY